MKILLLKNNINDLDTLIKGIDIIKQKALTIGLILDFELRDSHKQFSVVTLSNETIGNGFMVNPLEMFQEAKSFNIPFDIDFLVFDNTKVIGGRPNNPVCSGQNIQMCSQWYMNYPEVFAEFFLHELCHYSFIGTGKEDMTHSYLPQFSQSTTRTDQYLFLIKQNMKITTQEIPIVNIKRGVGDGKQTIGQLTTSDGQFGCITLEKAWLNNQSNISCIPKGIYTCEWKFFPRKLSFHYQVMNVPGRSGIFIHAGNYFFDTLGCILLGSQPQDINKDGELDIINSRVLLSAFEAKMSKKPFTLVVQ